MGDMGGIISTAISGMGVTLALLFFVGAYFFAVWDARRPDAEADSQIGLKIVLYTLALGALGMAAGGVNELLHYLLSGAKTGTPAIKSGAAGLVGGGLILAGIVMAMLPRTNHSEKSKVTRMALGFVAAIAGSLSIVFFGAFVNMMINGGGAPWAMKSAPLAAFITYGGLAFLSINKLGAMSGWTAPARPMPQPGHGGYQQSGGVPQQGYPPQQQGYPPQQQGYPPQQQGGYPPQGGMPPQGMPGGGYPPQGGGGYQPR
jgi:hypothetical protein